MDSLFIYSFFIAMDCSIYRNPYQKIMNGGGFHVYK